MGVPKITVRGRPPSHTLEQRREVLKLKSDGISIRQIAELVSLTPQAVQRICKKFKKTTAEILEAVPDAPVPKYTVRSNNKGKQKKKPSTPDKNQQSTNTIPLTSKLKDFEKFTRWGSYPFYKGLVAWQHDCYKLIWPAKYSEVNAPRDHGKSILLAAVCQHAMVYEEYDFLYLGWTDRRKQVADFVFAFFEQRDMIEKSVHSSNYHFKTTGGAKFDCYLITAKETLGMHPVGRQERFKDLTDDEMTELRDLFVDMSDADIEEYQKPFDDDALEQFLKERSSNRKLCIIIDDPIDDTFRDERHKELSLERRFDSTIYSINPDKFIFVGTRKFEGDFFDYIEAKFGQDLVIYRRGTGISTIEEVEDPVTGAMVPTGQVLVGKLLCPERFTDEHQPTYKQDLRAGKKDLTEIRRHVGEYWWHAEYEQDPHPVTGEIWEGVSFVGGPGNPHQYDYGCITVDRATTTNKTSDYTGIVAMVRNRETGDVVVTADLTDRLTILEAQDSITALFNDMYIAYPNIRWMVVVEKQGGGDDLIALAKANHCPWVYAVVEVHNRTEKITRITDYIKRAMIEHWIKLVLGLKSSELKRELDNFPYCDKFDAIDALANGYHQLALVPLLKVDYKEVAAKLRQMKENVRARGVYEPPWEKRGSPLAAWRKE